MAKNIPVALCSMLIFLSAFQTMLSLSRDLLQEYRKPFGIVYLQWAACTVCLAALPFSKHPITITDVKHATIVGFFYITSSYAMILPLEAISVSYSNVIAQLATISIYVYSIVFINERMTLWKNLSVCCAIAGVVLITVLSREAKSGEKNALWAILVHVLSCLFLWGPCYVSFTYYRSHRTSLIDNIVFLGLYSALIVISFAGFIPILHFSGIETLELPPKQFTSQLLANTWLKPLYVSCINITISNSSPLFHQIGAVLLIPLSIIVDYFVHGTVFNDWFFLGTSLVVISWGLEVYGEMKHKEEQEEKTALNEIVEKKTAALELL